MPSKFLRVKTAAVAGLALLSIAGAAAAASGLAPAAAERAARPAAPGTPDGQVGHAQGEAATLIHRPEGAAAAKSSTSDTPGDPATGPDASGVARHGLCQAWFAGQGGEHGKRADSTAFQALAAAAGGADRIPAYCQADASASAAHGQPPADPPARPSPPTTRRPRQRARSGWTADHRLTTPPSWARLGGAGGGHREGGLTPPRSHGDDARGTCHHPTWVMDTCSTTRTSALGMGGGPRLWATGSAPPRAATTPAPARSGW